MATTIPTLRVLLRHRGGRFLSVLRQVVLARSSRPLRQMSTEAQCSYGDVDSSVAKQGLESTVEMLRAAGVFLPWETFKGRKPIVRGGRHNPAPAADFVNRRVSAVWHKQTSGSTSKLTLVPKHPAHSLHRECYYSMASSQFVVREQRWISMSPIPPSASGITRHIWNGRRGFKVHRCYAVPGNRAESRNHRVVTSDLLSGCCI